MRQWAAIVVRAQSGGRRTLGTVLYGVVLLLASVAFTSGWLVRTSVGQRWDHAAKAFGSPHLTLTARTGAPLDRIGQQPGVHPIGARTRSMTETTLSKPATDQRAETTLEQVAVEPRMTVDTDNTPAGLLTEGRWLAQGASNETVLEVTFARQFAIAVGDNVWLNRIIPTPPEPASPEQIARDQTAPEQIAREKTATTPETSGGQNPDGQIPAGAPIRLAGWVKHQPMGLEAKRSWGPSAFDAVAKENGVLRAEFTVVGLAVDLTNCLQPDCAPSNLWVHEAALPQLGTLRWTSAVQSYHLDDPTQATAVAREAFLTYGREMRVATTASELRKLVTLVNGLLGTVVAGFGLFALLASAILISSTTSTRLASLRRDLGLLQVLGATSTSIALIVLGQNLAIGFLAALCGWGISFLLRNALVIGPASALPDAVPPWAASLGAVLLAVLIIIVASTLVPVLRAARLEPVEALRAPTTSGSRRRFVSRPARVNLIQTLPLRSFGLAWRTLVSQRRHFAVAGIALVLTGAAGVTAAGYDAALTSLASGTRDVGVSSDYRIVTDDPAQQARLDSALQTSPLVAAW